MASDAIKYHDIDGNEVSLDLLCKLEPAWAANRIRVSRKRRAVLLVLRGEVSWVSNTTLRLLRDNLDDVVNPYTDEEIETIRSALTKSESRRRGRIARDNAELHRLRARLEKVEGAAWEALDQMDNTTDPAAILLEALNPQAPGELLNSANPNQISSPEADPRGPNGECPHCGATDCRCHESDGSSVI